MSELERLKDVFDPKAQADNFKDQGLEHFTKAFFEHVEAIDAQKLSATTSSAAFRFPVLEVYLNPTGTFHGGAIAAIFDICTSWALYPIAKPGFWYPNMGVSRSLNVVYLRPGVQGEMVIMDSEVVHCGKRLALIKGVLKRERDDAILATCEHNKFNVNENSRA